MHLKEQNADMTTTRCKDEKVMNKTISITGHSARKKQKTCKIISSVGLSASHSLALV